MESKKIQIKLQVRYLLEDSIRVDLSPRKPLKLNIEFQVIFNCRRYFLGLNMTKPFFWNLPI